MIKNENIICHKGQYTLRNLLCNFLFFYLFFFICKLQKKQITYNKNVYILSLILFIFFGVHVISIIQGNKFEKMKTIYLLIQIYDKKETNIYAKTIFNCLT